MQKLMHSRLCKYLVLGICLIFSGKSFCQNAQTFEQIGRFLDDATLYSEKYITPATDAAVYQASAGWMTSPKRENYMTLHWDYTVTVFLYLKATEVL